MKTCYDDKKMKSIEGCNDQLTMRYFITIIYLDMTYLFYI